MSYYKAGRIDVPKAYLAQVSEEEAIQTLSIHKIPKTEIIRVWKLANAKSEPVKKNLDSDKEKDEKQK